LRWLNDDGGFASGGATPIYRPNKKFSAQKQVAQGNENCKVANLTIMVNQIFLDIKGNEFIFMYLTIKIEQEFILYDSSKRTVHLFIHI